MAKRGEQVEARMGLTIENPVPGVGHSLQQDNAPLEPQKSAKGESLHFAFPLRIARKPDGGFRFYGKQVQSEGKLRQFVYIRIGVSAGDHASCWSRRMKVDIHDIAPPLVEAAMGGKQLEGTLDGTAEDGSPACATIHGVRWQAV